jgi:hypothetical protein
MQNPDDDRLARAARLLRKREGLGRLDLVAPGRSRHFGRRLEAGEAGGLRIDDVREHFARLGAQVRVSVWWNGAGIDRLFDQRHAELVERSIQALNGFGWRCETEVTFSEYGERGSIDLFGAFQAARCALVGEVKSEWGGMEETLRRLDVKARLAPKLAAATFGFRPVAIGRLLILPEDRTARRIAARHQATLDVALPARNREVRAWLRQPSGPLSGLWFLSEVRAPGSEPGAS